MSAPSDVLSEAGVLTTEIGHALMAEVATVDRAGPADIGRWRKTYPLDWVAAALRLVEGRRKGASKFDRADRMWFDPIGVEQATSQTVAHHKAERFPEGEPVVDLCAGIGGDSIALGRSRPVIAVDLDHGMARRSAWNAAVYDLSENVLAVQARAESFPIPSGARVHVDPDRRASSRGRARRIRDYTPDLESMLGLTRSTRGGAIKLGPASDFETHFSRPGLEIELISLAGECKEATIWFGDLSGSEVIRRATCLPSKSTWTNLDGPLSSRRSEGPLQGFVFDPDPALSRSGLLDGFGAAHGLHRIAAGLDLLTGPSRVDSPFLSGFEVLEVFPIDLKVLRREVATRGLGPLEIKTRGLEIRPEAYRTALRPPGPNPATLILVGGQDRPGLAILACR